MSYLYSQDTNNGQNNSLSAAHALALKIINAFLDNVLHTVPTFRVTSNRIVVHLFYYTNSSTPFTNLALSALGTVLSRLYPNLTVELRFVRVHRPYYNASILAQYLAINAANYGFSRLENTLLNTVSFVKPEAINDTGITYINGVKIQLSGLLTSQRAAPRKTVFTASAGTFNTTNSTVTHGMSTSKSRIGAFTVKTTCSFGTPTK